MSWFYIALIAPFLWAICNLIDKVLIEKYMQRDHSVVVLLLYSMLFSVFVFPVVYMLRPAVIHVELGNALLFMLAGVVEMAAVGLYLRALLDDDASRVVPFYQLIPLFSVILGYVVLGEVLTMPQLIAGAIIIMGGMLLTFEFSEDSPSRFKWGLLGLMLLSSFCYSLYDTLFKFSAIRESFWAGIFWQHLGSALAACALLVCARRYRAQFFANVRTNGAKVVSLNLTNEFLYTLGIIVLSFSLLLAPIALVATANVYQPIFVFVIGLFFTLFLPHILEESLSPRHMAIKGLAIVTIFIGSAYLLQ
ncbi:MAG TPA: EamA family transporter [Candidatus Paceibacterota bacterium]|jgi:uncharacterized membrane protein